MLSIHNVRCCFAGDHVTLTVNVLDIMMDDDGDGECSWYFIDIRDGEDEDAPLIGRYCRNKAPPHITSQGSALFVHAVSLYGGHYDSFSATYSVLSSGK